jgi:hypothetical protein
MDDVYTQLASNYLNGQDASNSNQPAPNDIYHNLAKNYLENNSSNSNESNQNSNLDGTYTQLATQHLAQTGQLKKDDPDSYFDVVHQNALDPNYDPVAQTASDKINGQDTRDFNFDIYNARNAQGFKKDVPITNQVVDGLVDGVSGLVHSAGNASFWNRIGEATYQEAPMFTPIGWALAANGINPELPSISGRSVNQNIGELESALDIQKDRAANNVVNLKDAFTNPSFLEMSQKERNDYFDKKVDQNLDIEKDARGQGFIAKNGGFANDVKDVEGVKDASNFMFTDPTNIAFAGIAPILGEGVSAGLGKVATSPLGQKIGSYIPSAATIGSGALKGLSKVATPGVVGTMMGAADYAVNKDPIQAIERGMFAAATDAGLEHYQRVSGKISDLSDYVGGNPQEGYTPPQSVKYAEKAWNAAKTISATPEFKNALGGAIFSTPFVLAEDDPEKKIGIVTSSLAAGATLGTVSRLGGLLDARYSASKNADFYNNLPTTPTEYGTQYDALTADVVNRMSQEQKNLLFRQRHIVGNNGQIYVVPDDQFQNIVQPIAEDYYTSQGHDADTAKNLASSVTGQSVYYGADPMGTPRIFVKESAFNPDNMTHEVGHFISDVVKSNVLKAQNDAQLAQQNGQPISPETQAMIDMGKQLESAVPTGSARKVAEKAYIEKLYNLNDLQKQINDVQNRVQSGDPQAQARLDSLNKIKQQFLDIHQNGLPDNIFKSEWLADQFSLASRGLMSGKQAGLGHAISRGLGSFLDSVAPNAVSDMLTTKQTPLGFRPSFIAADVFDHWINGRAQEISQGVGGVEKSNPSISAENAHTQPPEPPSTPPNASIATEPSEPLPVDPTQPQAHPQVVQDATDALTGLKAFGKKLIPSKVDEAIESLRAKGVDVTQITTKDIVAEALKGRGETPIAHAPSETQVPTPTPLPKKSPLEPPTTLETSLSKPNLRVTTEESSKIPENPTENINPNAKVDVKALAKSGYKNKNGLSTATKKSVNKNNLSIDETPISVLKGKQIDTTQPVEATILKQALADSDNPEVLQKVLNATQEAIANKKTVTVDYGSAKNDIEGSPSEQSRSNAQSLSDKGFLEREDVKKSFNPLNIEANTMNEPILEGTREKAFDNLEKFDFKGKRTYKNADQARAGLKEIYDAFEEKRAPNLEPGQIKFLLEKIVPNKTSTRLYSNNFSYDKFVGNKDLLARAIVDSGLHADPYWKGVLDYLKSDQVEADMKSRLNNVSNGYRGDGQPMQGIDTKVTPLDIYKPTSIDDFKVQILNALEGGPANTFFREANQNLGSRGILSNPLVDTETANPFWNKLKALGDDLKLNEKTNSGEKLETTGIGNIIESANEKIRLDRVKGIGDAEKQVKTSSYPNRAIGFTPGTSVAEGIDATIKPKSLKAPYNLQGLAASSSQDRKKNPLK